MLKKFIEAALYLSKQALAFRGNDTSNTSLNRGRFTELLDCFFKFDSGFEHLLHRKLIDNERSHLGVFTGVSTELQNDLIYCINWFIDDQVRKEIMECTFISIQADETDEHFTSEIPYALLGNPETNPKILVKSFGNPKSMEIP